MMEVSFTPAGPQTFRVEVNSTVYELTKIVHFPEPEGEVWYLLFADRWENHNGDWLKLPGYPDGNSIAWSYLTEKVPGLRTHEGDKEGWIMVLKEAGIEVFG